MAMTARSLTALDGLSRGTKKTRYIAIPIAGRRNDIHTQRASTAEAVIRKATCRRPGWGFSSSRRNAMKVPSRSSPGGDATVLDAEEVTQSPEGAIAGVLLPPSFRCEAGLDPV